MPLLKALVIFDNTTCLYHFSSNITYFWQKYPIKVWIFRLFTTQVKINQISHVIFRTKSSSNFGWRSVWWEMMLLYFFSCNCAWFGQNESIKVQNFRLSTANVKFHQICTLIGSLKNKILDKKCREVISHDPEDWCKIWRKTDVFQK